jgi:hypothetical protein
LLLLWISTIHVKSTFDLVKRKENQLKIEKLTRAHLQKPDTQPTHASTLETHARTSRTRNEGGGPRRTSQRRASSEVAAAPSLFFSMTMMHNLCFLPSFCLLLLSFSCSGFLI